MKPAGFKCILRASTVQAGLFAGADAAALARYVAVVMHGMAVQAAGGAGREDLRKAAESRFVPGRRDASRFQASASGSGTRALNPRRSA